MTQEQEMSQETAEALEQAAQNALVKAKMLGLLKEKK
jgi:hypothetical protein